MRMRQILNITAVAGLAWWLASCETTPSPPNGQGTASIEVRSDPSGAAIYVDGVNTGKVTPAVISNLAASPTGVVHTVRLERAGYRSYATAVTLYSGAGRQIVSATLIPDTTPTASLRVQTSPAGAEVFLNGSTTGRVTPTTFEGLGQSLHVVEVRLADHKARVEQVDLRGKTSEVVTLILTREGRTAISGTVYDKVGGGLVVGATIQVQDSPDETVTSGQGTFAFENLARGYYDLMATKTLGDGTLLVGRRENVYVDPVNGRMMTADILMATPDEMGQVSGRVIDSQGRGIANAWAYLDMSTAVYFTPVDPDTGGYSFVDIPRTAEGKQYYVTASAPGYGNGATQIFVEAGHSYTVDVQLSPAGPETPAAPLVDYAQALTYPAGPGAIMSETLALRSILADGLGEAGERARRIIREQAENDRAALRAYPPDGHVVEIDVGWLANEERTLAGYVVRRSENATNGYADLVTIWDPNATFLADTSPDLGPDVTFYYDVTAFNYDGVRGGISEWLSARPLGALRVSSPEPGSTPSRPVRFAWDAVARATVYEILVFDRRPDYDTKHQAGIVWRNQSIPASQTSIGFGSGGELVSDLVAGETYYVALIAGDGASVQESDALSFSRVVGFTAP